MKMILHPSFVNEVEPKPADCSLFKEDIEILLYLISNANENKSETELRSSTYS
ncbi:1399_t:CDS:2 [Rhizophagus irregularis]|nr:1399_t:CDS:2 [Rhizophagus irregularis]